MTEYPVNQCAVARGQEAGRANDMLSFLQYCPDGSHKVANLLNDLLRGEAFLPTMGYKGVCMTFDAERGGDRPL